ncbi:hypothetical protein CDAR_10221 [Caerostris darwini]|uniref:Uncharacterized protein n=1 Tax=Caerostris darwini TaxID=1538125 RepID=A0AAV4RG79_9ARAC|nr:hypothetical protein CDAR_10221 [Caerostris darwini]
MFQVISCTNVNSIVAFIICPYPFKRPALIISNFHYDSQNNSKASHPLCPLRIPTPGIIGIITVGVWTILLTPVVYQRQSILRVNRNYDLKLHIVRAEPVQLWQGDKATIRNPLSPERY